MASSFRPEKRRDSTSLNGQKHSNASLSKLDSGQLSDNGALTMIGQTARQSPCLLLSDIGGHEQVVLDRVLVLPQGAVVGR